MSVNVGIKENDKTKNFTVNSLMIDLQNNGGLSEWVLESDLKLDTISIDQNGTYTPSSDYYGFSQATVKVMQVVQGTEDDKHKIIAVDPNTDEIVETVVPTDFPTIGGDTPWIVGNDPNTGSPVIAAADSGGTIHETGVDPEFLPIIDNIIDKGLCDPYVPGLDNNGDEIVTTYYQDTTSLITSSLPSSISIIRQPSKLEYSNGESIDISGMVVVANMGSGGTWTNASYPNGHIPLGQLSISPSTVSLSDTDFDLYTDDDGLNLQHVSTQAIKGKDGNGRELYAYIIPGSSYRDGVIGNYNGNASFYITSYNDTIYAYGTSAQGFQCYGLKLNNNGVWEVLMGSSITVFPGSWSALFSASGGILSAPVSTKDPNGVDMNNNNNIHPVEASVDVTVSWVRPVDGKTLSAAFSVTVSSSGSGTGSTDGSGYSDDSGGSESGGGVHF